jgi:hypothetical protein
VVKIVHFSNRFAGTSARFSLLKEQSNQITSKMFRAVGCGDEHVFSYVCPRLAARAINLKMVSGTEIP